MGAGQGQAGVGIALESQTGLVGKSVMHGGHSWFSRVVECVVIALGGFSSLGILSAMLWGASKTGGWQMEWKCWGIASLECRRGMYCSSKCMG